MACLNRLDYATVAKNFLDAGCELLSPEYRNARTHLQYRCSCNNVSTIVYDSFRRGHRCMRCAPEKRNSFSRLSTEKIARTFANEGCTLLSPYINNSTPVEFVCHCGEVSKITYANFQSRKRCGKCGVKARSGQNHYEWKTDRQSHADHNRFRQKCYKALARVKALCGQTGKDNPTVYGYRAYDVLKHIQSHPNWPSCSSGKWHIDHIFPVQAFLDLGIRDPRLVNCLENLQPLTESENCSKGDSYDPISFRKWLHTKDVL